MDMNTQLPAIQFEATNHTLSSFEQYQGKWIIVYFYPKDATPGCTTESCDFRDNYAAFSQRNTVILGVSRDSLSSHEKFKATHQFPFELISDKDEQLCQLFDVMKMKSMFGKKYKGIERSTFLIDPSGKIQHVWRKVSVKGHVAEVLNMLQQ